MTNHFTKGEKKAEVIHTPHQSQRQSLDAPPKPIAVKKKAYPYQQAPKYRSQVIFFIV